MSEVTSKVDSQLTLLQSQFSKLKEDSETRINVLQDKIGAQLLIINKNTVPSIKDSQEQLKKQFKKLSDELWKLGDSVYRLQSIANSSDPNLKQKVDEMELRLKKHIKDIGLHKGNGSPTSGKPGQ